MIDILAFGSGTSLEVGTGAWSRGSSVVPSIFEVVFLFIRVCEKVRKLSIVSESLLFVSREVCYGNECCKNDDCFEDERRRIDDSKFCNQMITRQDKHKSY